MTLKDVTLITANYNHYLTIDEITERCLYSVDGERYEDLYSNTLNQQVDWVKGIIASPDQIGLVYEKELNGGLCLLSPFNGYHLSEIEKNNDSCKIEIQEPLHFDKNDIHPKDIKIEPLLVNNKVVIHLS
jgi:hypothetical protein